VPADGPSNASNIYGDFDARGTRRRRKKRRRVRRKRRRRRRRREAGGVGGWERGGREGE